MTSSNPEIENSKQGEFSRNSKIRRTQGLRPRTRVGKYRIEKLIGTGGFAQVFSAIDMIEGVRVALKIPFDQYVDAEMLDLFRAEVRIVAKLDHPNILPLRNADIINDRFVVATRLGSETLDDRLGRRLSVEKALFFTQQMIAAVSYAHESQIVHCDIKPENFILFDDDILRLTDFGIAKVSRITIEGSGTGTVGHMAPEQAMGKPSMRSDVFSLGLIIYRMLTGTWPEYPFVWPFPNANKLRSKKIHPDLIAIIRKCVAVKPRDRFADAVKLEEAFEAVLPKVIRNLKRGKK
jgi:serine/threonine-protein kinase